MELQSIIGILILIPSVIIHELAHGFVADRLGDPTARLSGRLTLNPLPHIDPIMSVLVPLFLIISHSPVVFGAAKPVPVDPFNLREGRKDMALVALAGPLSNVLLAVLAAVLFHILDALPYMFPAIVGQILTIIAQYNLLLAIFNLIPIPPLDGSKIFSLLLSDRDANAYLSVGQTLGTFILLFLLFFPIGSFSLGSIIYHLVSQGLTTLGL